jgi:DNA polymerase-3 subunit gamma/tau
VTVLSRCLQFNLKLLPPPLIAARLAEILRAESIAFEDAALALIARVAHGSMRDALSILDQAIAYGAGEVRESVVRTMLGAADADYACRIADALVVRDGPALLAEAHSLAEHSVSLSNALEELAALFHRIAVAQTVPDAATAFPDAARVKSLAQALAPEFVQLAYQICVQGRADLVLAPDETTGFTMTLLRLLAFEPAWEATGEAPATPQSFTDIRSSGASVAPEGSTSANATQSASATSAADAARAAITVPEPEAWPAFVAALKLSGMALQLAAQTALKAVAGNEFVLAVPESARHLTDRAYADKLKAAMEQALGRRVRLRFEIGGSTGTTLAAQEKRERDVAQAKTEAAFRDDPFVQDLLTRFDARIKPNSIKPV